MPKIIQIISLGFITAILVQPVSAYQLSFDGSLRERFEIWDGLNRKAYGDQSINSKGKKIGNADDQLWLQLLNFGLTYKSKRLTAKVHLYDARAWGWSLDQNDFIKNKGTIDEYVMDPYEEHLELFYGYLQTQLNDHISFKVGRQRIWYGDKRIFGPSFWANSVGWLWDAAKISYKRNQHFVDMFYGQVKTRDPESFSLFAKHAFQGFGIYSHFQFAPKGAIEPFFLWKNALYYNSGKQEDNYFFGLRAYDQDFNSFNYDATWVERTGAFHQRQGPDLDVDAYAYVLKLGYTFKTMPFQPKIVIGRIYASGDSEPKNNEITSFARPFGATNGGHYGRLDAMFWGNMVDNQINLHLKPHPKWHIKIAYHRFYLAEKEDQWSYYKYKIPNNRYDHIGDEIDGIIKYNYSKTLQFQCTYAYLKAGNFITGNQIADNNASRFIFLLKYKFDYPI